MSNVRVRFPPSPTGYCHVGTARMALLNFLFAKKNGGTIVFRIEDTDKERSTKEFEEDLIESISWLGLSWDEFYRQSERTAIYVNEIETLISQDKAYVSEEESKKEPGKKVHVVRLRNPGEKITFQDVVRGEISFDTTELGDFAIARAINDPLYHLTVVVDDTQMNITHVIRGEEHISNTPRQILIQKALGYERPVYAHYPLFLGADKSKLSKRKGDVAVKEYRETGFLPEAMLNYIGTLGWTPPSGKEFFSLDEMIAEFDLKDLHKSGAVFDLEKLRWFNRHYLTGLSPTAFKDMIMPEFQKGIEARNISWNPASAEKLMGLVSERISVLEDLRIQISDGEYDYFFADPALDVSLVSEKKSSREDTRKHLEKIVEMLSEVSDFSESSIKDSVWPYASDVGRGAVLWPLRYSLSGREKSPDPFFIAARIGKDATLRRISTAIQNLAV